MRPLHLHTLGSLDPIEADQWEFEVHNTGEEQAQAIASCLAHEDNLHIRAAIEWGAISVWVDHDVERISQLLNAWGHPARTRRRSQADPDATPLIGVPTQARRSFDDDGEKIGRYTMLKNIEERVIELLQGNDPSWSPTHHYTDLDPVSSYQPGRLHQPPTSETHD